MRRGGSHYVKAFLRYRKKARRRFLAIILDNRDTCPDFLGGVGPAEPLCKEAGGPSFFPTDSALEKRLRIIEVGVLCSKRRRVRALRPPEGAAWVPQTPKT